MRRILLLLVPCFLSALWTSAPPDESSAPKLRVPPGFVIEKIAGEPDIVFPMFAVFDDRGRLFVSESSGLDLYAELQKLTRKCRISVLEDPDARGRFQKAHVFADKLVFPMGLAWRDGKLYVADPPDLVTLEDAGGKAGKRTVLLSGFGHRDNGSLHGLLFGPDGLLYLTMGHPDGYKFKQADGTVIHGKSGALVRCRADGSQPEVICRGFENLVEVVFTPRGEVIGTDNWFHQPTGGVRDALVHLVEGGLYPLHFDEGTRQFVSGEPLPGITLFPAVALSGLVRYRGDAFPPAMRGNLFSAQHNARKVVRHVLLEEGSTFRTQDFDFVTTDDPDFHPSDVLEAPDGSLIVVDTGSWYVHHCPTGQIRKVRATGGIYRVRALNAKPPDDPLGQKIDWLKAPIEKLIELLGDRRPMVRDRAQQTLSSRGKPAVAALAALLEKSKDLTAKLRGVWALVSIPDETALPPLRKALRNPYRDANPDVAITAARGLALRKDSAAASDLGAMLTGSAQVRMAAAQALAPCGSSKNLPAIWDALTREADRFLEHALLHAAHRHADAPALVAALKHPRARVQKAALLLLDQPPRPAGLLKHYEVMARVTATDADLRQTALNVLQKHPEWAKYALGLVRGWLEKASLSGVEENGLRGLLLAFQGEKTMQELIGAALRNPNGKVPMERRVLVLETVSQSGLAKLPQSWTEGLTLALQDTSEAVRTQAVRTAAILQVPQLDKLLSALAQDKKAPSQLRLEALRAVTPRRPQLSSESFALLQGQLAEKDNPLARLTAAEILGRCHLDEAQLRAVLKALRGDALVSPNVLVSALKRSATAGTAESLLDYLAESIRLGWRPGEKELDALLKALPAAPDKRGEVRTLLQKSTAGQQARLAAFEPLLAGGNADKGRDVFFGKKTACSTCHRIGKEGGIVGPDLTKIGAIRSGRDILESIVLPSSTIAQGYENYLVVTKDGRIAGGVIARQTAQTLVLRDSSGAELRLRKDQIQEINRQPTSLMPEGLERTITAAEFRDLLAFLQSLK
jgi:putative membrane-bound dehydrogenase-like protein